MMREIDAIEREIADFYPAANVEWLAADYWHHCQGIPSDEQPAVHAWIDDQPAEYLDFHGVPPNLEGER